MIDATVLAALDTLSSHYVRSLDGKDLAGWADCFAEDRSYICTTSENWDAGLPIAFMHDNSAERMADRITTIERVWKGTFEDYQTRHFVQRTSCVRNADGDIAQESNFLISFVKTDGRVDLLASGRYIDRVALADGHARYISRASVLDAAIIPRYLVYPI